MLIKNFVDQLCTLLKSPSAVPGVSKGNVENIGRELKIVPSESSIPVLNERANVQRNPTSFDTKNIFLTYPVIHPSVLPKITPNDYPETANFKAKPEVLNTENILLTRPVMNSSVSPKLMIIEPAKKVSSRFFKENLNFFDIKLPEELQENLRQNRNGHNLIHKPSKLTSKLFAQAVFTLPGKYTNPTKKTYTSVESNYHQFKPTQKKELPVYSTQKPYIITKQPYFTPGKQYIKTTTRKSYMRPTTRKPYVKPTTRRPYIKPTTKKPTRRPIYETTRYENTETTTSKLSQNLKFLQTQLFE
jgi:hypothetical protein